MIGFVIIAFILIVAALSSRYGVDSRDGSVDPRGPSTRGHPLRPRSRTISASVQPAARRPRARTRPAGASAGCRSPVLAARRPRSAAGRSRRRRTRDRVIEQAEVVDQPPLEVRAGDAIDRAAARAAARRTFAVSGRIGSSQNQPSLANIASRQRWTSISADEAWPSSARRRGAQPRAAKSTARLDPDDDVDVGVARRPGVRRPGESSRRGARSACRSPPASRSSAELSGAFQRPSAAHPQSPVQRRTP